MSTNEKTTTHEPMVDAKYAAAALCLPYYWFSDSTMRAKLRMPHYLLGGLVRYRMSELTAWAARSTAVQNRQDSNDADSVREAE
ncbi:hypothetical protein [Pseudomonas sp.]|uniref:hypothetical protein n=1 Tax=Pseudomonas sp. TaxID=306 RepID=UPI0040540C39